MSRLTAFFILVAWVTVMSVNIAIARPSMKTLAVVSNLSLFLFIMVASRMDRK